MAQEWLSLLKEQVMMSASSSMFPDPLWKGKRDTFPHLWTCYGTLIPTYGPVLLEALTNSFHPPATSSWSHGYPRSADKKTEIQKG
jgi:hypothetical protein